MLALTPDHYQHIPEGCLSAVTVHSLTALSMSKSEVFTGMTSRLDVGVTIHSGL